MKCQSPNSRKVQAGPGESALRAEVALPLTPASRHFQPGVKVVGPDSSAKRRWSTEAATANNRLVERLGHSRLFREFQPVFEEATGLPLTLRAVESWQLAHTGSRRQNRFCTLMSQTRRSCAACLQVQQRVCENVNGGPCTLNCTFGLSETAVAVKIGNETIAYLQTGQVFFKPPTPEQTRCALRQIREWGLDLDPGKAARRYEETPVVCRNEYQARVQLLQFFASQLGLLANQIVLQQKDSEPAQIVRARQFIDANSQDKLSLPAVARQVGMSRFYFCKTFAKVTGVHFSRYVSCVRVEKAKNLLLNQNYRVSEIAFATGFQSLTHFNRLFKTIAGETPTEYRRHLPIA